jgi:phytoene dehydrogenase-like protein
MEQVDGIVIGAGHNGLITAAYLAKAGFKMLVIERNPEIGGGTTTDEVTLPGFRHNLHANFHFGCVDAPWVRDLELHRYGFSYILPQVMIAMTYMDGTCVALHQDPEKTAASIARISKQDAETFRSLHERYAVRLRPLVLRFAFSPPLPGEEIANRLKGPDAEALLAYGELSINQAIEQTFEHDKIRNWLRGIIHARTVDFDTPGTGGFFPAIFSGLHRTGLAMGGSLELPRSLVRIIEECGGSIIRGKTVKEITLKSNEAREVVLDDGTRYEAAKCVVSAIDAPQTMNLVGEEAFEDDVVKKLKNWKWGDHTLCTIHLALNEAPKYASASFDPDINRTFNVFMGPETTEGFKENMEELERGEFPTRPMGNGACNSLQDPTYAPAGKHVAFWWPFTRFDLHGDSANWDGIREEATERLIAAWRGYAPNLTEDNILASYVFTPLDISRRNINMGRGAVQSGAYDPDQSGINRPHPTMSSYRTPIKGLYLCGSTTGSGGGMSGAPGHGAANAIAEDLKIKPWWEKVPSPEWNG